MSGCSKEEAREPTEPVKLKIMAHDEGTFIEYMVAGWPFNNVYRVKLSENMKEEISNAMTNVVKEIVKDNK